MNAWRSLWHELEKSWIQTCGVGWTPRQIAVGYVGSVLLAFAVVGAAYLRGLGWSWVQAIVAGLVAWDLFGGAIGYNHPAIKRRSAQQAGTVSTWHHNLQHIHPLILIFFAANPVWLSGVTVYWFATFLLYVTFLEAQPATGRRRLGEAAQRGVVVAEVAVALALFAVSWVAPGVTMGARNFGIVVYAGMAAETAALLRVPAVFQRTAAVMALALMLAVVVAVTPPAGFEWLVPVYLLKLLVGYTAKEPAATSV